MTDFGFAFLGFFIFDQYLKNKNTKMLMQLSSAYLIASILVTVFLINVTVNKVKSRYGEYKGIKVYITNER